MLMLAKRKVDWNATRCRATDCRSEENIKKLKKKPRHNAGASLYPLRSYLGSGNISRLKALGAFFYLIGDRLTFGQSFETRALDRVEMHEHIIAARILRNKTKTFGFVKPLYSTCSHIAFYLNKLNK